MRAIFNRVSQKDFVKKIFGKSKSPTVSICRKHFYGKVKRRCFYEVRDHEVVGQVLDSTPTKKVVSYWYGFFYPNRRFGISSRFSVHLISSFGAVYHHGIAVHTLSCGLMIYNALHWWYSATSCLMIYTFCESDLICKPFLFLAIKNKSFTLYPFRSIYGVSFNYWFA